MDINEARRLKELELENRRLKRAEADKPLSERLLELAAERPRFGYRRLHVMLEREGREINRKRVYRVYRDLGLAVRRKKRKRVAQANRLPIVVPIAADLRGRWISCATRWLMAECFAPSTWSTMRLGSAWQSRSTPRSLDHGGYGAGSLIGKTLAHYEITGVLGKKSSR